MDLTVLDVRGIDQLDNSRTVYGEKDLADLMANIKEYGLLQPIGVAPTGHGRYEVVFGNRRFTAIKKLGWKTVPTVILDKMDTNDIEAVNLVENLQRENVSLAEEGRIYVRWQNEGLTPEEIAARLSIKVYRVYDSIRCFKALPEEVHAQVCMSGRSGARGPRKKGMIAPAAAREITSLIKNFDLSKEHALILCNEAAKGTSVLNLRTWAPLLKNGMSLEKAKKQAGRYVQWKFRMVLPKAALEAYEAEYGSLSDSVRLLISAHLERVGKKIKRAA